MSDSTSLVPVDKSALSVVTTLENAKQWLATAVEMTDPAEIAEIKARVVTAETYARELRLSKDIQQNATELRRRAEYALGKSIRKGQAEGTIRRRGQITLWHDQGDRDSRLTDNSTKASPYDFADANELSGPSGQDGIYAMSDDVPEEQFETALTAAKAEGNLSRVNVIRKVKQQDGGPTTPKQRADLIRELAGQGYTSRQMPNKVGVTVATVRKLARDFDIDLPADRAVGSKARHINSTNVVVQTATALEGLVMGVELIDYDAVDTAEASQWVDSLSNSLRVLNRFRKQIKETTQ